MEQDQRVNRFHYSIEIDFSCTCSSIMSFSIELITEIFLATKISNYFHITDESTSNRTDSFSYGALAFLDEVHQYNTLILILLLTMSSGGVNAQMSRKLIAMVCNTNKSSTLLQTVFFFDLRELLSQLLFFFASISVHQAPS